MKSTSRLRVLSDIIPRVLVFVYFYRGLSRNTEERPTRRDYIEISTCHGKEVEAERSQALGARPVDLGARLVDLGTRPLLESKQDYLSGSISTDLKEQG